MESKFEVAKVDGVVRRAEKLLRKTAESGLQHTLAGVGLTAAERAEGWRLALALRQAMAGMKEAASPVEPPTRDLDEVVRAARRVLLDEVQPLFRRCRAALVRRFPERAADLFFGVSLETGDLHLTTRVVLARVAEVEDPAVGALLAERGLTVEVKQRLEAALAVIEAGAVAPAIDEAAVAARGAEAEGLAAALRAWLEDMSEVVRTVVKGRAAQVRLGVLKPRPTREE